MPEPFRLFEIILYAIISFIPYLLLALFSFRHSFRFSKPVTGLLIIILTLMQIGFTVANSLSFGISASLLSICSTVSYGVFFLLAVKDHPGKLLFVLLMVSNIANFVVVAGKCLEGILFPANAYNRNSWSFSLTSVLVLLIIYPFLLLFLKNYLSPAISLQTQQPIWRYLWIIPATFYLFWYHSLYFTSLSSMEMALNPVNTLFTFLINLGAILVYYVIVMLIQESQKNLELNNQNHLLAIQTLQYEALTDRMEETRRCRHDLRQHINTITSLVQNEAYDQLLPYLNQYQSDTALAKPVLYCKHISLNALLSYYAQQFQENHIRFQYSVFLPETLSISDTDLSVLFGNLLENALDGCMTLPEEQRELRLNTSLANQNSLVLTLDNRFEGSFRKDGLHFLSTKHQGTGIGTESARAIVARYHGDITFNIQDNWFYVSAVLYL